MCVCRSSRHRPAHRWAILLLTTKSLERGRSQKGTEGCSVSLNSFDSEGPRIPPSLSGLAECGDFGRRRRLGTEAESVNGEVEQGCLGDGTWVYLGHPTSNTGKSTDTSWSPLPQPRTKVDANAVLAVMQAPETHARCREYLCTPYPFPEEGNLCQRRHEPIHNHLSHYRGKGTSQGASLAERLTTGNLLTCHKSILTSSHCEVGQRQACGDLHRKACRWMSRLMLRAQA